MLLVCSIFTLFSFSFPVYAAYEDFTSGWTEVDPNADITWNATTVDAKVTINVDAYVYKSYGAGYFDDFTHALQFIYDLGSSNARYIPWAMSNDLDDWTGLNASSKTAIAVEWMVAGDLTKTYVLRETYGGTEYTDTSIAVSTLGQQHLVIHKVGTTLQALIFNDTARTQLYDTLTLTLQADHSFQYLFATQTANTGNPISCDGRVHQLDINYLLDYPSNEEVTITNMEGCGDWVFAMERFYNFQAVFSHQQASGNASEYLDTTKIAFTDGVNWINASLDVSTGIHSLDSGADYVNLRQGTESESELNLTVTFQIYFTDDILDYLNADILMWCNATNGKETGWQTKATDYFNIYNLGGHSILTSSGNAGRVAGGDVFELWATDNGWVSVNQTFRKLQHVKFLFNMWTSGSGANGTWNANFTFSYCTDQDEWIEGLRLTLSKQTLYVTGSVNFGEYDAHWYLNGTLIKTQQVNFHVNSENSNGTVQVWIDFWINRVNASSIIGGRVNAYEFPMKDNSDWWLRWWASNWGVDEDKTKQSMAFETMTHNDGSTLYAPEIKMVRIDVAAYVTNDTQDNYFALRDYDVYDLTFAHGDFEGIQTPVFDATKVPAMQTGGFIGALFSIINYLGKTFSDLFGTAILDFWNVFVGFMDTVFATFGFPDAFSTFINMLGSFWTWMTTSFTYILSFLGSIFTFLASFLGKVLNTLATAVTYWVQMLQNVFGMLDGTVATGINIWDSLGLSTWLVLLIILYPIILLTIWDEEGFDKMLDHIRFLMDAGAWILNLFLGMIQMAISIITGLIESTPVVE